ncbi:MAG: hypothetical protein ATN32_05225 [Candidatus Epulonipiscium fishelsonii]|nr:MAG: hypothetical protein ATN32_05225 [Epulopiscium sp. AS2M-Bin002]
MNFGLEKHKASHLGYIYQKYYVSKMHMNILNLKKSGDNTFSWPEQTQKQRDSIEIVAQAILNVSTKLKVIRTMIKI